MYWIYSALLGISLLVSLPYWLWQRIRHGKYRVGLGQRLGGVPEHLKGGSPTIWLHAVSLGEVLAVTPLVEGLKQRFPAFRVAVSTTTDTGQELARARFGESNTFYFPLDFVSTIRPYLDVLKPKLVIVAETEFWPNFLHWTRRSGARIAIVNARISDKSWPGYRRFRGLLKRVLQEVDLFLTQTEEDRRRLIDIGAPAERVAVSGNLKFDSPPPSPTAIVASLGAAFAKSGSTPVLVCGSTVEGEEPLVLQAFVNILASYPRAVMVLAPRHPERFAEVAALLNDLGLQFWKRSLWSGEPIAGGVLLLDTIGELSSLYGLADVAFVGGSLVPKGGHNIIEPAQHGVPIVVGNHTENFRDIVGLFQSRDAVRVVGPAEFPLVLMELISNPAERAALGKRAAETLQSQTGATERTLAALQALMNR